MAVTHQDLIEINEEGTFTQLKRVPLLNSQDGIKYNEAFLEKLIFSNPSALPIHEIDNSFTNHVPICTQLSTSAGILDVLFITPSGRIVIVEAKLWRNPESRRKVVAQILDYAAELKQWSYEDLERETAKRSSKSQYSLFRTVLPDADESEEAPFVDAVTKSLHQGRFLLLICGDGIREGLGSIADFLEDHTTLDLTFGLIEFAIFDGGNGRVLVHPRVLAKTVTIKRQVITIENKNIQMIDEQEIEEQESPARVPSKRELFLLDFWTDLADRIHFDESRQPPPNPSIMGYCTLRMPVTNAWIGLYFIRKDEEQGLRLTFNRGELGDIFYNRLLGEKEALDQELPIGTEWQSEDGKHSIWLKRQLPGSLNESNKEDAFSWFQKNANMFVNAFRPRLARYKREL